AGKHTKKLLKKRETFAKFLPWAREIIKFIDLMDLENVSDRQLSVIRENARIGYEVPADINQLLKDLSLLRAKYHQQLKDKGEFSRGFQYLTAARLASQASFEEFDEIIFANFFYFNKCEEAIVYDLYKKGKATFLFQGDERKWPIFKRTRALFNQPIHEADEVLTPQYQLQLYTGYDIHSQVCIVKEIIQGLKEKDPRALNDTVLVLPHADLIVPVITEVTALAGDFNISMGYPIKRSSLYTLIQFLFKVQMTVKDGHFYTKHYLNVLRHPFIKNLDLSRGYSATRILIHKLEEILTGKEPTELSGRLFIKLEEIESHEPLFEKALEMIGRLSIEMSIDELRRDLQLIHQVFFKAWMPVDHLQLFAKVMKEALGLLSEKSLMHQYPLNVNILQKMQERLNEYEQLTFHLEPFTKEELFQVFENNMQSELVPFIGSPLKGLQILGLFETRALNFKHVIVLDMNEGILPNLSVYEPLIPREVLVSLNLDRLELDEEIQRYQFMRLISSAENVHLIYQERKDKERSRFIEELIWLKEREAKKLQAVNIIPASFQIKIQSRVKTVRKTPQMITKLKNHTYSASSINTYLNNPMDFYERYILGLRDDENLLEDPEARQIGTFVHGFLEEYFKPFLHKTPTFQASDHKRFMELFDNTFEYTFGRSMKSDAFLLKAILQERLERFYKNEYTASDRRVKKILFLEKRFEDMITLSCGDIRLSYIVDRVDEMEDGQTMIVDYKTGSADILPKNVGNLMSGALTRERIRDEMKSFQLPLYYCYLDRQYSDKPINAALYNLRTIELHKFISAKNTLQRDEVTAISLKALDYILNEILDPAIDFIESD
ncbi:MAG: PD-(D/E)XK nuclease family protein, partial [Candidatus Omnitrophica bacterium]|nr:PD-(D/E)XK nuclease family protein [Candidatus Omnitrophota bacterium]